MSKGNQHIDQILKQKLSDWQAGYDKQEMEEVWDQVEQQIGGQGSTGNGSEGTASSNGGSGIKSLLSGTKGWFMGSVAAAAITGGAAYMALDAPDETSLMDDEAPNGVTEEFTNNTPQADNDKTARPFDSSSVANKAKKEVEGEDPSDADNQRAFSDRKEISDNRAYSQRQNPKTTSSPTNGPSGNAKEEEEALKNTSKEEGNKAVHHFPAVFFQQDFMRNEQTSVEKPVVLLQQAVVCHGDGLAVKTMNFEDYHKAWYQKEGETLRALKKHEEIRFESPGNYELTFKLTKNGETRLEKKTIRVAPLPEADFGFEKIGYQKVRFQNKSQNAGEFQWDFGNGEKSGQRQPIHYFQRSGSKQVKLKASNEYNCEDAKIRTLTIEPFPEPEIPNTLTPNGDGKNDKFTINIANEVYYYLIIKNSEGEKVFESTNKERKWDGTMRNQGKACDGGTYHYIFEYRYKGQQKKVTKKGPIYLKRQ